MEGGQLGLQQVEQPVHILRGAVVAHENVDRLLNLLETELPRFKTSAPAAVAAA